MDRETLVSYLARLNKAGVNEVLLDVAAFRKKLAGDAYEAVKAGDIEAVLAAVEAGAELGGAYSTPNIVQAVEAAVGRDDSSVPGALLNISLYR